MAHEKSVFSSGDQDYDSAIGWDPAATGSRRMKGTISEQLIEEDKKRNPRAYAKRPEMLFSLPMKYWLGIGVGLEPVQQLFGPFWNRGELAIMYGAAGVGKSALATQLAECLARGLRMAPFNTEAATAEPEKVLYLDFELGTEQLAPRYSILDPVERVYDLKYDFSENLTRSVLNWNGGVIDGYEDFSDMFFTSLTDTVEATGATVVIIDNITFLDESTTSNANTALSIMQSLNRLKRLSCVSILVLAHTRKRRPWEDLTGRDLQGSVNLANFADSLFAIGQSRINRKWRYAKQIRLGRVRSRSTRKMSWCFRLQNTTPPPLLDSCKILSDRRLTIFSDTSLSGSTRRIITSLARHRGGRSRNDAIRKK